jgi:hypothetical protein
MPSTTLIETVEKCREGDRVRRKENKQTTFRGHETGCAYLFSEQAVQVYFKIIVIELFGGSRVTLSSYFCGRNPCHTRLC